jgi:hypothetical protein
MHLRPAKRRAAMRLRRLDFPELAPSQIAEEVAGTVDIVMYERRWELWLNVRLKRSMKDHDINAERLRRELWIGFDGDDFSKGWKLTLANVSESTLVLRAEYKGGQLKRFGFQPRLRIAHRPASGQVGGALLEIGALEVIRARDPRYAKRKGQEDEPPF